MERRDLKETLLVRTDVVVVMTGVAISTNVVAEGEIVPAVVRAAVVAAVAVTVVDIGDRVDEGSGLAVKTFLKNQCISSLSVEKPACCVYLHITWIEEALRLTAKVSLLFAASTKV